MRRYAILAAAALAQAEDWPKWRGPRGDGISMEKGLAQEWPKEGPKKLWSKSVGKGWNSPVAVEGILYAFGRTQKAAVQSGPASADAAEQAPAKGPFGTLTALRADTGEIIWQNSYTSIPRVEKPSMRATPTVEKDRIYTFDDDGELVAWNRGDGKIAWQLNVLQELGAKPIKWGCASSPAVEDGKIYVQGGLTGSLVIAVDKNTGKVAWKSQAEGPSGYATIVPITVEGRKQLLVAGGDHVVAMDRATGKTAWSVPYETEYKINAATPVVRDGKALLINEYKIGKCIMLQLHADRADTVWEDKDLRSRISTPILEGDVFYVSNNGPGQSGSGIIECRTWADGKLVWSCQDKSLDLGMGGTMLRAGELMITLSQKGMLSLAKVTPEGCQRLSQVAVLNEPEVWSTPVIHNGRLYIRGFEEMICLDIAAK